jgi:hypothetical protein
MPEDGIVLQVTGARQNCCVAGGHDDTADACVSVRGLAPIHALFVQVERFFTKLPMIPLVLDARINFCTDIYYIIRRMLSAARNSYINMRKMKRS